MVGRVTEVNPPSWQQAGTYSAAQDRMTLAALLTPDPAPGPFAMRGGVRPSYQGVGLQVTQAATPDMGVLVGTGTAWVPAAIFTNAGWTCHNDGTVSLAVTPSSPANPRIDLVIAHVYDSVDGTDGESQWLLEVVPGAPAASPVPPALPGNAIPLAQVTVGRSVTSITNANITDVRTQTVALGGVLPCFSTAMPASPHVGMCVFQVDTSALVAWTGSAWKPIPPVTLTGEVTSAFRVNVTTPALVPGMSVAVQPGAYHLKALVAYSCDQDGGNAAASLHFGGTNPTGRLNYSGGGGGASNGSIDVSTGSPGLSGPAMSNGSVLWFTMDAFLTFSVAQTVSVFASTTSGASCHVQIGSYLEMRPL